MGYITSENETKLTEIITRRGQQVTKSEPNTKNMSDGADWQD